MTERTEPMDLVYDGVPEGMTVRTALRIHYGDDYARAIDHIASVVNTYRTEHDDVLVFRYAQANSVYGYDDTVLVANYNVLRDSWQWLDGYTDNVYSDCSAIGLRLDDSAPEDLIRVIDALENYPLLDDDEHSAVEQAMIDEHWQAYGLHDTLGTITDILGVSRDDLPERLSDIVTALTFGGYLDYGYGDGYPTIEDMSSVDFGTDAVARFIADNLGSVVTVDRYGHTETFNIPSVVSTV